MISGLYFIFDFVLFCFKFCCFSRSFVISNIHVTKCIQFDDWIEFWYYLFEENWTLFTKDIHLKSKICFAKQELLARILRNITQKLKKKYVIFYICLPFRRIKIGVLLPWFWIVYFCMSSESQLSLEAWWFYQNRQL